MAELDVQGWGGVGREGGGRQSSTGPLGPGGWQGLIRPIGPRGRLAGGWLALLAGGWQGGGWLLAGRLAGWLAGGRAAWCTWRENQAVHVALRDPTPPQMGATGDDQGGWLEISRPPSKQKVNWVKIFPLSGTRNLKTDSAG